jgi:hypothetical protein
MIEICALFLGGDFLPLRLHFLERLQLPRATFLPTEDWDPSDASELEDVLQCYVLVPTPTVQ